MATFYKYNTLEYRQETQHQCIGEILGLNAKFESNAEIDIYYDKPIQLGEFIDNRAKRPDIIMHNKRTNNRSRNN